MWSDSPMLAPYQPYEFGDNDELADVLNYKWLIIIINLTT